MLKKIEGKDSKKVRSKRLPIISNSEDKLTDILFYMDFIKKNFSKKIYSYL